MIEETPVDIEERRWLQERPAYQVQFWTQLSNPEPPLMPFWRCDSRRIVGGEDVTEALEWAEANADGRRIALYAEVDRGPVDQGMVLVIGTDPTHAT